MSRYNSVLTLAFTVHHNDINGADITDQSLLVDVLQRIADVSANDGMVEATFNCQLTDTQETSTYHDNHSDPYDEAAN